MLKYFCLLHGQVFVMKTLQQRIRVKIYKIQQIIDLLANSVHLKAYDDLTIEIQLFLAMIYILTAMNTKIFTFAIGSAHDNFH